MIALTGASGKIGGLILPSLTALDSVVTIYHTKLSDIKINGFSENNNLMTTSEQS